MRWILGLAIGLAACSGTDGGGGTTPGTTGDSGTTQGTGGASTGSPGTTCPYCEPGKPSQECDFDADPRCEINNGNEWFCSPDGVCASWRCVAIWEKETNACVREWECIEEYCSDYGDAHDPDSGVDVWKTPAYACGAACTGALGGSDIVRMAIICQQWGQNGSCGFGKLACEAGDKGTLGEILPAGTCAAQTGNDPEESTLDCYVWAQCDLFEIPESVAACRAGCDRLYEKKPWE